MKVTLDFEPNDLLIAPCTKDEDIISLAIVVYSSFRSQYQRNDFFNEIITDLPTDMLIEELKDRGYDVSVTEEK